MLLQSKVDAAQKFPVIGQRDFYHGGRGKPHTLHTCLSLAVEAANFSVVQLLLQQKADVHVDLNDRERYDDYIEPFRAVDLAKCFMNDYCHCFTVDYMSIRSAVFAAVSQAGDR